MKQKLQQSYQARLKLKQIKYSKIPIKMKVLLLESLRFKLNQQQKQCSFYKAKNNQIAFQSKLNNSSINKNYIQKDQENQLVQSILQKQRRKIQLDQDIQTIEDDLFQIEKVITTKRKYEQELTDKIQRRTYEVQQMMKRQTKSSIRSSRLKQSKSIELLKQIFG